MRIGEPERQTRIGYRRDRLRKLAPVSSRSPERRHGENGLKNGLSFVLSAISVVMFSSAGIVAWPEALLMMAMATVGAYAGAYLARALPKSLVRSSVVLVGTVMSVIFFVRSPI